MATQQNTSKKTQTNIFISMNMFGHEILKSLLKNGVTISKIFTINKNKSEDISDYKDFSGIASRHGIKIKYVDNINSHTKEIKKIKPDYIFCVGWSQILKKEFLSTAKYGCIGSHPALLPKNRGRAAIPWHFINNEKYGGITFFFMDEGCDSGDIIVQKKFIITDKDNAIAYYKKIIKYGKQAIKEIAPKILSNKLARRKQDEKQATYLLIRTPEDSYIDFLKISSCQIFNQIRGVAYMYPIAFAYYNKKKIQIYESKIIEKKYNIYSAIPGQIIKVMKKSIWVKTIGGIIELKEMHNKNNKLIDCQKFFKVGHHLNR